MKNNNSARVDVNRKRLLTALQRIGRVTPNHTAKPVLEAVELRAYDGKLHLAATDLDVTLTTAIEAKGKLPPCLVSCSQLTARIKAGRGPDCSLTLADKGGTLCVNGGRVEHRIKTMNLADSPLRTVDCGGHGITVPAIQLREALATCLVGVARQSTRYAINGLLLESDDQGVRLVATDGRRLATVELEPPVVDWWGTAILPTRFASLIVKLVDRREAGDVRLVIQARFDEKGNPLLSHLHAVGADWTLSALELEGHFPVWRDVVPESASRFVVDRRELLDALTEVATATSVEAKAVRFDLQADQVRLIAKSAASGESVGTVLATFRGGGDDRIITAFNPPFLIDALKTLSGDQVVIDVGQNQFDQMNLAVRGRPALIYSSDSQATRWLIMPVSTELPPSHETLGSNYPVDDTPLRKSA